MSAFSMQAQESKPSVDQLVSNRHFVFKAQFAQPLRGTTINLTADYDLKVLGDSLVAFLPYFGRAFSVVNTMDGGVKFSSSGYKYKAEQKKKDWRLTFTPKDHTDIRQLFLTVYDNGRARLQVTSNNRDPIAYNGYIIPAK
jgi:hypothetical protein